MNIAFYTPWEIRDGIYEYTKLLRHGLKQIGVPTAVVPYRDELVSPAYLEQVARELNGYQLIHIQHEFSYFGDWRNPFNHLFADFLKGLTAKKVVTAHIFHPMLVQLDPNLPHPPFRLAKKLVQKLITATPWARYSFAKVFGEADRVVVHSQFHRQHLIKYGVDPAKVVVMPMGIDPVVPVKRTELLKKFPLTGKTVLTVLGFVDPAKGYDLAIRALERLPSNCVLLIAGGTRTKAQEEYQQQLWQDVERLGLTERVFQTGYLTDLQLSEVMCSTDIQLVPQLYVAGSQSLQTGLGFGKAIVASDLPYAKDIQARRACLSLFKSGEVSDLVRKIKFLLNHPGEKIRLEAEARKYGREYSWKKVALLYKELYEDLLRPI